jgi:hypothetical protein
MQFKLTLGIERPSEMVRLNNRPYPMVDRPRGHSAMLEILSIIPMRSIREFTFLYL